MITDSLKALEYNKYNKLIVNYEIFKYYDI